MHLFMSRGKRPLSNKSRTKRSWMKRSKGQSQWRLRSELCYLIPRIKIRTIYLIPRIKISNFSSNHSRCSHNHNMCSPSRWMVYMPINHKEARLCNLKDSMCMLNLCTSHNQDLLHSLACNLQWVSHLSLSLNQNCSWDKQCLTQIWERLKATKTLSNHWQPIHNPWEAQLPPSMRTASNEFSML